MRPGILRLLGVLWVFMGSTVWAQVQTTTAINGIVSDVSGGVIPGVSITVRNQETGALREAVTGDDGFYSVTSLKPGTYSITASLAGFKTAVVTDREVLVAIPALINFTLQVGELSDQVTVSAEGQELINTSTPALSATITQNLVENLPNQTRNYFDLLALAPNTAPQYLSNGHLSFGAHSMRRVNAASSFESSGVFVAGSNDNVTNVSIDGSNVQMAVYNMPVIIQSSSTIKELRLETASGNAEFGFGANAVNVITKSGTNQVHGEVFWQHRNDNLDAVNFFTNLAGRDLPEYKRNKFGASLGGPIMQDKLHFFANYEGSRLRQNSQSNTIVPTAEMRRGNLSNYRPLLPGRVLGNTPVVYNPFDFDPATGLRRPFPNNTIPTNLLDPAMQKLLEFTALPNTTIDGVPQYSGLVPAIIDENQYSIRLDWEKSSRSTIYGRFTYGERDAFAGGLVSPLQGESTPSSAYNAVVNWNEILSPTMINALSVGGTFRMKSGIGRPLDVVDVSREAGLKNTSNLTGGPGLSVPDFTIGASGLFVWDPTEDSYQIKDDFSWNRGPHGFKMGFNLIERRMFFVKQSVDKGRITFDNIYTRACPLGNQACETARTSAGLEQGGLGFGDFLLGSATGAFLEVIGVPWHGHQRYYGGYFQDTWQVDPRLTVNLGLRYEVWKPWLLPRNAAVRYNFSGQGGLDYALRNPLDVFNPATRFGREATLNPNLPREGYETDRLNFGPRIGFAYLLGPDTTIRAGGGIFYANNVNTDQMGDSQTGADPFIVRSTQQVAGSEQLPPLSAKGLFPAPAAAGIPGPNDNPPASPRALGQDKYPSPTVYQWSLSVDHRFNQYWSASIDYLGSRTIHNQQFVDLNSPALPQGNLANLPLQQRRRFPLWGQWLTWVNWGYQNYNSATLSVRNREWRGLSLLGSFMWAKSVTSSERPIANDRNNYDFRNWDLWRGKSVLTPDFRFISGWSYRLPVGQGRTHSLSGVADAVLGGWVVSGITEFSTGSPRGVFDSDNSGTGLGLQHANRVPDCDIQDAPRDRFRYFNTGCFVQPVFGTWGTAGQGILNEPGINNWNVAIGKLFNVREEHSLEFKMETFNTFNHTQWMGLNLSRQSASFGRITSARPARQIQMGLYYRF